MMRRQATNKRRSSKSFRKASSRTKSANMRPPQRGGYRF